MHSIIDKFSKSLLKVIFNLKQETSYKSNPYKIAILQKQRFSNLSLRERPNLDIAKYMKNVSNTLEIDLPSMIVCIIFMDKYFTYKKPTEYNIHKVFVASLLLASKLYNDRSYDQESFSIASTIPLRELAKLEIEFMEEIDYQMNIDIEEFMIYEELLVD